MNILVKLEHFIEYQNKYNTSYLDKKNGYRIWSRTKDNILEKIGVESINEMLDGTETNYEIFKDEYGNFKLLFNTNNKNKYRFDLQHEKNTNIYHLIFSGENFKKGEYERLTDRNESIELFSRLSFILKDFSKKLKGVEYCIGATNNESKNRLYEYFMIYTKSWEKRDTEQYDLGWALYFKI